MIALPEYKVPMSDLSPMAYGYGRQSHRDQIDANEALPQQGVRTKAYFTAHLESLGVKWGGFVPDDSPVSARTNPFMARHAGKLLFDLLRPGDYFIIDKIDRLWRSVEDLVAVMKTFKNRGIQLCIANMMGASVTLGTPMGDFMLNLMVCIAQLESDQVSNRTRARFAGRRAEGRYPGSRTPMGCRLIGAVEKRDNKVISDMRRFTWCEQKRRFMGEIVRLADEDGLNCSDIRPLLRTHFRELMGDRFFKEFLAKQDWTAFVISRYFWREKQYRALPPFDPNTIRFSIFDPPGGTGFKFRDIGRSEPKSPNVFPFLDGRPTPSLDQLLKLGA